MNGLRFRLLAVLGACVVGTHSKGHSDLEDSVPKDLGLLWPIPQVASLGEPNPVPLGSLFEMVCVAGEGCGSDVIRFGIDRYLAIIAATGPTPHTIANQTSVSRVEIRLTGHDDSLSITDSTDYKYLLRMPFNSSKVFISCPSVFGALAALETFSQLVVNQHISFDNFTIIDGPQKVYRGLMVDAARRYIPMGLLESLIDGMAYSKLNVFHFHVTDWSAVRVASPQFPELTQGLEQFYTHDDVKAVVEYARLRGIRVLLDVDVPSHCSGWLPLIPRGIQFCGSLTRNQQLYADPENATLDILKEYYSEIASLTPEAMMHIGADEAPWPGEGNCTEDNIRFLLTALQDHLITLGKIPVAWNDLAATYNAAREETVIQEYHSVYYDGHKTILSLEPNFYLNKDTPMQDFYVNLDLLAPDKDVIGGAACMWSDEYCEEQGCGAFGHGVRASAWWMHSAEYDDEFMQSFSRAVWPRAAVTGGTLWNFIPKYDSTQPPFRHRLVTHARRLEARGIVVCPVDTLLECHCLPAAGCTPYPTPTQAPRPSPTP